MAALHVAAFFGCAVLGGFAAYGSACMFWGAAYPRWLFQPIGACLYLAVGAGLFFTQLFTMPMPNSGFDPLAAFSSVAKMAFLGFPFGLYLGCLLFRVGASFFEFSGMDEHTGLPNHMDADAAMAREDFNGAIALYRVGLEKWPDDLGTVLRLSRAMEAAGKFQDAEALLDEYRRGCMPAELGGPPYGSFAAFTKESQDRLAALTVALAGFHQQVYSNKERARELCMEILPYLTNHTASQPVKDRLAKLG